MENTLSNAIILANEKDSVREILTLRLSLYIIITVLGISACRHDNPGEPMCRVAPQDAASRTNIPLSTHSACLIRLNDQVLSIQYSRSEKMDVPSGVIRHDESAQCAAHRHTWQTTGFNVEVGRYLGSDENNTQYYQCTLAGNFTGSLQTFPVPPWAKSKVSNIQLIDPFVIQNSDWQGKNRLVLILDMFNLSED